MISKIHSTVVWGMKAISVDVEADMSLGVPGLTLVGLPDQAVKESKDRVRAALKNSGYEFPPKKITVSLAPADMKKEGPLFDLPIALSVLNLADHIKPEGINNVLAVGELSLDGSLRPVKGIIQIARLAQKRNQILLFPAKNSKEVSLVKNAGENSGFIPVKTLQGAIDFLNQKSCPLFPVFKENIEPDPQDRQDGLDFKDVKGQETLKRAIEIAVSGGHNCLMMGPPGGGKTMLAKRIPSILPRLTNEELLEVISLYGLVDESNILNGRSITRPFRSPHHSLSTASLVGGGTLPQPGEVSLAHQGVLFLDELSEFKKDALESLRVPLEDKRIVISRVSGTVDYPSSFMLVAASNPCRCGYLTSKQRACRCTQAQIEQFRGRLSGPLLDRIDIHVEAPEVTWSDLRSSEVAEDSAAIKHRVENTRLIQMKRYQDHSFSLNSKLDEAGLKTFCELDRESETYLKNALDDLGLSARAYSRILKIARTIADMEASDSIQHHHLQEATSYRLLDRQFLHV